MDHVFETNTSRGRDGQNAGNKLSDDGQFSKTNLQKLVEKVEKLELQGLAHGDEVDQTKCQQGEENAMHWMKQSSNFGTVNGYPIREPLAYLRKTQMCWEKRIYRSLNTICTELRIPMAQLRSKADRDELIDKWCELSQYEVDVSLYRPVYAPKDLLEVLLSIRSPNFVNVGGEERWEFSKLPLSSKTMAELKEFYVEISRGDPLLGVDRHLETADPVNPTLEAERTCLGEKAVLKNTSESAKEFLKQGCPVTLRGRIWSQVLESNALPSNRAHYKILKHFLLRYDLLVDKLVIKDIQLTASNDDQFFAFEDILYEVVLMFTRDTEVLRLFEKCSSSPMHAVLERRPAVVENTVVFPPCGVIPFHGFCMYAAPFCYVYDDSAQLYFTFRKCYMKYFYKLHEISSDPEGLVSLCLLYERLLQRHEPELWFHFQDIRIVPLCPVFKWLMRAFSGHLPPEQLLFLWDVIFAYDSLEILPLLACAILSFRKTNLLKVNTQKGVEAVLADLSSIAVMPLIQFALLQK